MYKILKATRLDSPIGQMLAISDEKELYLLEFIGRRGLEREIERLRAKTHSEIVPGKLAPVCSIEKELKLYFKGKYTRFHTPIKLFGTPFQAEVWKQLQHIPFGETRSYLDLARSIGNPKACRAVAQANGSNQLAIIIPCHRIIQADGKIGGYAGGIDKKQRLLDLEKQSISTALSITRTVLPYYAP